MVTLPLEPPKEVVKKKKRQHAERTMITVVVAFDFSNRGGLLMSVLRVRSILRRREKTQKKKDGRVCRLGCYMVVGLMWYDRGIFIYPPINFSLLNVMVVVYDLVFFG